MTIRRINFYSGPCCGKSVMAAYIFTELKKLNVNVELIQEAAKDWAYEKRSIKPYNQLQLFAEQTSREYRVLESDDSVIAITDSPINLGIIYAKKYLYQSWKSLVNIAKDFELEYPSLNFFLTRGDCIYSQVGRFENYEEAKQMDREIEFFLMDHQIPFIAIPYNQNVDILKKIIEFL